MVELGADPMQIAGSHRPGTAFSTRRPSIPSLRPILAAGCAALVAYATEDLAAGARGPEWPMAALANVVEALKNMLRVAYHDLRDRPSGGNQGVASRRRGRRLPLPFLRTQSLALGHFAAA
jgi:hypothetical protein